MSEATLVRESSFELNYERVARKPQPVTEKDRIVSIDVLRGLALLGILPMNIQYFSMVGAAYFNPTAYGDLHGANYWVWLLCHVLADEKFMTIFSMLFGAGVLLMTSRVEASGRPSAALHYRRMGWLILFGMVHAYLLWSGDILFSYGMCGLVVYLVRTLRPRTLLLLGLLTIAVGSASLATYGVQSQHWSPADVQAATEQLWKPTPQMVDQELAAYRGQWSQQMHYRVADSLQQQTTFFLVFTFWRVAGLMLVGMGLFKLGIFSGRRAASLYWVMIAIGGLIGIPIILYGTHREAATGWDFRYSFFYGAEYNYWASMLVSLGWVGAVMLASRAAKLVPLTRRLAAVGRMAFTNYIMHTVMCTTLFYGFGFGLFGKVERLGQFGIVLIIWGVQLIISPIWLRYFQFGPLEWLWRSLTYLQWEPLRRPAPLLS